MEKMIIKQNKKKNTFRIKNFFIIVLVLLLILLVLITPGCFTKENKKDFLCLDCNVILISIDTLRADHLGCYGYRRNTSPNIDKFAEQSIVFEKVYSQSPFTAPSHMTMFTSLYPSVHGINNIMAVNDEIASTQRLSDSIITLPQILKERGYITSAFTGGAEITGKLGFDKGFDIYEEEDLLEWLTSAKYNRTFGETEIFKWIEKNQNRKFFLFFHTYSVHGPYISPYPNKFSLDYTGKIRWDEYLIERKEIERKEIIPYINSSKHHLNTLNKFFSLVNISNKRDIEHLIALYDSSIFYTDENLKILFDKLEELNLLDKTIVIFTSDHGEEFLEHRYFQHWRLYNEHIHVPLIIRLPKKINKTIKEKSRLIDLTPTILDILNIHYKPKNYQFQGVSLIPLLKNEDLNLNIYSENTCPTGNYSFKSLITNQGWKYIFSNDSGFILKELFYLSRDPKENKNLMDTHLDLIVSMEKKIEIIKKENEKLSERLNQERKDKKIDKETLEKLKSLGYIN